MVKVVAGYPAEPVERGILERVLGGFEADVPPSYGIGRVADAAGLNGLREAVRRVRVEASLVGYITAIVRATRGSPVLTLGASPRGSVSLLKMAQAAALLAGRPYVVPDDVKELAPAVLRHRVAVAAELELEGITADAALRGIIEKIEAPR
jgi:MoxR-like ATPase